MDASICASRTIPRMKIAIFLITMSVAAVAQTAKSNVCAIPDQPLAITRCEPARIYVADFDRQKIEEILSRYFDGFTILPARGCWHKTCENSLVIEIAGAKESDIRSAAEQLRVAGKQQQVLVVIAPVPRR